MPSSTESKDSDHLQHRAKRLTTKLHDLAARHFDAELATPSVRFDLRGTSAGQVRVTDGGDCLIRYNARLLERHPWAFLSQTIPHETAHLVAFSLFGPQVPPHGREWRAIMVLFGATPERCHHYRVDGLQVRHLRRYDYRCACRIHQLTSIRHNRVRSGQLYRCRQCGQPLERSSA
ncbi:SprT-like domain-containing protein [Candidatus Thiosymbion oneisti]|uniref:SprT family zinc-dependent metalloprotease n=1 Tax=Candidatus Thiosymbion oneisti TaxID=589554 RepID=UPI0013FDE28D|nr:SprT-like domain-containing protein [Candidatus Thiosymbion oneisti]